MRAHLASGPAVLLAGVLACAPMLLGASAAFGASSASSAAPRVAVSPALRASAMLCLGEALRLCPNALAAPDHGLSCIVGKRRLLSAPCRGVYDQGLRVLRGGDLHLRLRPPRSPGSPGRS